MMIIDRQRSTTALDYALQAKWRMHVLKEQPLSTLVHLHEYDLVVVIVTVAMFKR